MTPPTRNPAPSRRLWPAWVRVILYTVVVMIAAITTEVAVALFQMISGSLIHREGTESGSRLLEAVLEVYSSWAMLVVALAVTWLFTRFVERRPLVSLGFQRVKGLGLQVLLGFGIETVHFSLIYGVGMAAGWYHLLGTTGWVGSLGIMAYAFLLFIPAAAFEEVTMRGYVLQTLEQRHGAVVAVVGNSAIFAALHLANPDGTRPVALLGLFAAGIYLSLCYLATRNLWFPTAVHAA